MGSSAIVHFGPSNNIWAAHLHLIPNLATGGGGIVAAIPWRPWSRGSHPCSLPVLKRTPSPSALPCQTLAASPSSPPCCDIL